MLCSFFPFSLSLFASPQPHFFNLLLREMVLFAVVDICVYEPEMQCVHFMDANKNGKSKKGSQTIEQEKRNEWNEEKRDGKTFGIKWNGMEFS